MDTLLVDAASAAASAAVVNNLIDYFVSLRDSSGAEVHAGANYTRWHTHIDHPWYNGVTCSLSPGRDALGFAEETVDYFKSRGVPVFSWWCQSQQTLSEWAPILTPLGFRRDDATPGMAVNLRDLNHAQQAPAGLEIRMVKDLTTLAEWVHTLIVGYELPLDWSDKFYRLISGMPLDWSLRYYLGYLDGRPVSTSTAYLASGVIGVYCVATLPEARGRGLGAALTLASLEDGIRSGYQVGILQSSNMGYGVYKKLGFQHICQVDHFVYVSSLE